MKLSCKNFKRYKGRLKPKSKCCYDCWIKWYSEELSRLLNARWDMENSDENR